MFRDCGVFRVSSLILLIKKILQINHFNSTDPIGYFYEPSHQDPPHQDLHGLPLCFDFDGHLQQRMCPN